MSKNNKINKKLKKIPRNPSAKTIEKNSKDKPEFAALKLTPNQKIALKLKILEEANLLIGSVNWTEGEINKKFKELDNARGEFLTIDEERLEIEIKELISRLNREISNMDDFLDKYKKIINAAKRGLL